MLGEWWLSLREHHLLCRLERKLGTRDRGESLGVVDEVGAGGTRYR